MWTITVPVISTCHISPETVDLLVEAHEAPGDVPGIMICAEYEEGYFIRFDDGSHLDAMPDDLAAIFHWLAMCGFDSGWVRLDRDGDDVEDLPVYE